MTTIRGVRLHLRWVLGVMMLFALSGLTMPAFGQSTDPMINEFVLDHIGSDNHEFVEIFGAPNTDYSGFTILQIEGDSSGAGVIDRAFVVGTTDGGGFWTTPFSSNVFENGTLTLLLVEDFSSSTGIDLDTNNDGVLDSTPWTRVVDDIAVNDGGSSDRTYAAVTLAGGFDGVSFNVGGASRIPNGTDTDSASDWMRNDYNGEGLPDFTGTPVAGEAYNTPGAVNEAVPTDEQPEACGDTYMAIYAIQGSGEASPAVGNTVSTEGIVVGDFQDNDGDLFDTDLDGFYIQDETGDGDGATSDGVFVYAPGAADVAVGDHVRVRGTVAEYNGLTELNLQALWTCSTGHSVAATPLSLVGAAGNFEAYEGMLVTFPDALTISEYFNFDRYGEIVLTDGRQFQPTAVYAPGSGEASGLVASNQRNRITLDDGRTASNPDPAYHPNGQVFTLDNRFRGGDLLRDVTGVVDYRYDLYRIQPTAGAVYVAENERPAGVEATGGQVHVASFNVLNYFLTLDTGGDICGPALDQECRGADNVEEWTRQRDKILSALRVLDADVVGLIEMENSTGVEPLADLVAGLNGLLGAGTYAYIDTGTIGTDAIRVGLMYKPGVVGPVGDYAVLDSTVDARFLDGFNRPVLAQTFVEKGTGARFTVAVNHLKSKGSACDDVGDPDTGDGQGNCNITRTQAARALVDWLATDPTGSGDGDYLIMGDLNAYDKEDPIVAILVGADDAGDTPDDYVDLVAQYGGEYAYSYVFDGQLGYLDHALANGALASQVSGATVWHINADEPDILDYDTSFKQAAQAALYAADAYRASDHDPVVVGLTLEAPAAVTHLTYRFWRVDRVQGLTAVTLYEDGTFLDNESRSGTWYAAPNGRLFVMAYPPGVACGAVILGKATPNLKVHGGYICQDDFRFWGIFRGTVDALPVVTVATVNAASTTTINETDIPSLCDPRNADLRAWMAAEGAEVDPCYSLALPLLTR